MTLTVLCFLTHLPARLSRRSQWCSIHSNRSGRRLCASSCRSFLGFGKVGPPLGIWGRWRSTTMKWLGHSLARRYSTTTNYAVVRSRSRSHEAVLTGREDWDQLYSEEVEAFAAQPKKIEEDWFVSLSICEREAFEKLRDGNYPQAATVYGSIPLPCFPKKSFQGGIFGWQ